LQGLDSTLSAARPHREPADPACAQADYLDEADGLASRLDEQTSSRGRICVIRALLVSIPPLVGWFGTVLGGVWTDYLLRTVGVRWSRALPIGLSRLLAVFAYLVSCSSRRPGSPWSCSRWSRS
jgi:hypothetical protein